MVFFYVAHFFIQLFLNNVYKIVFFLLELFLFDPHGEKKVYLMSLLNKNKTLINLLFTFL